MPFVYMMFSVLSWSLFPLVSALGIHQLAVFDYILWTYVVGLASSWIILRLIPGYKDMKLPEIREVGRKTLVEIFIGCLSVLLSFACLLVSFSYISKSAATVVFEIWPIIAMYIAPMLIKKGWEKVSPKDLVFSLLAFIGVGFLLYPEAHAQIASGDLTCSDIYKLMLPLVGGVLMAVASVLKSRVSYNLENRNYPIASLLKVQVFFSTGVVLLAIPFAFLWPDKQSVYTQEGIMAVVFIGVFIYTLGNVAYTMGVLRSAKSNIVVLWYLMPVFAVIWLWLAGQADITEYIVFGAAFILTSNLIITVKADGSLSYPATMTTMLLCGVYTYFLAGLAMEDYYQALSVPIVFYAILAAFMMDRLIKRDRLEEWLAVEMINYIDEHAAEMGGSATEYSSHVVGMVTTSDTAQVNRHYRAMRNEKNRYLRGIYSQLDQLALSKVQGNSFSELFILFMVCLLTVVTSVVYRPNNFIADGFAIILSLTIVFIFFTILDLSDKRRQFYLERDQKGERTLSQEIVRDLRSERIISALLILIILTAIMGLLWAKHYFAP